MNKLWTAVMLVIGCASCSFQQDDWKKGFENPPEAYRPMPFWHLNGFLTREGIENELQGAKNLSGFGGVTVLPVSPGTQWGTGNPCPGTGPAYLSDEYFDRYADILDVSEKQHTEVILYDDIDYPSGSAGGRLAKEYPQYLRKYLIKEELMVKGGRPVSYTRKDTAAVLAAASALNEQTREVVDLAPYMQGNHLEWQAPAGEWRVMFFNCGINKKMRNGHLVDYMQPEAVSRLLEMTYDEYDKRFSRYFGNVITKTFFDDVGFDPNVWTPAITDIFKEKYGKNPALYYPALFYDIGPETGAARVAFFDIRSELMAEGYVKQVSQWSGKRHLSSMGHPPENYSPNSVLVHGDILKYYRHVQIPLLDAIFFYGRGLHGFKQISSAADRGDKPVVGAELCGAFPANMDSLTLYRVALEAMARGVNFVVPHGMWYTTDADKIRIPPLIAPENPLLRDALPNYSACVGRSCYLLQGGRRVSDIALLWPITAIQSETYINQPTSGLPVANWLPDSVNHHVLSDLLTNRMRRDFTFVHPEDLCNGKITAAGSELVLNNETNWQHYKVLLLPGGDVISAETLKAIKHYYDHGGKVIATSSLPKRAAEFGRDEEVVRLVTEMFGIDPRQNGYTDTFGSNGEQGCLAFLRHPTSESLTEVFTRWGLRADIAFDESAIQPAEIGRLNYIHKQKDGRDFYYITNTTDNAIRTAVALRGRFENLEFWNPHTGAIDPIRNAECVKQSDGGYITHIDLSIPPVSGMFIVGKII